MTEKKRAVVAMSGGVDSSVAAGLLVDQGYEVIGITMRLWTEEDPDAARHHKRCCSVEDTSDARAAADVFGIRHYVLNLEREFKEGVVDHFVAEYTRGRTPNPCLACNDKVKFRPLLEHALALEADYLATGHYVRVEHGARGSESLTTNGAGARLLRAIDPDKDQSYVLYTLRQAELSRTLFPVGAYPKDKIRALAHKWALPNADKPDSADICFIPIGNYRKFVRDRVPVTAGDIVDTSGATVGQHEGIVDYTIGQRRGLPARGNDLPLFVVDVDAENNRVVVGEHEDLMAGALLADELTWVSGAAPVSGAEVQARIRYRAEPVPATVKVSGETAEVRFQRPQRAVTPGQAVVFYDADVVLGGGTIVRRL
ncbi:MAG TPA: tRNA 2-thiouridine(34) synthase MnmA [Dehalococcoidia bacterium]|nr:tRNA 2-thiouridine(34) synthase MnmA [Dehalococcoidia bacterium]